MLVHPRAAAPRLKPLSTPVQSSPVGSQLPPCHTRAIGMVCGLLHWASCCDLPSFCNAPIFSSFVHSLIQYFLSILFCLIAILALFVSFPVLIFWTEPHGVISLPFILLPVFYFSIYFCIEPHTFLLLLLLPFSPFALLYLLTMTFTFVIVQPAKEISIVILIIIISFHNAFFILFYFLPLLVFSFTTFLFVVDCIVPLTVLYFDFPDLQSVMLLSFLFFTLFPF